LPRHSSRTSARPPATKPAPRRSLGERIVWWPIIVTLLVIFTAAFVVSPIRDAATLTAVDEVRLDLSPLYLLLSPISAVLDTISLLTVGQHIALIVWVIALFIVWRVWRANRGAELITVGARVRREALAALALLAGIVIVYAAVALLPRPMAQLLATDDTVLTVDFHSHTRYSHDGRPGWTEEDVRDWHSAAGYDVAYITDHASYEGAERGIAANPAQAGEGTMLLQGIEAYFRGEHVNVLSAGRVYRGILTPNLKDVDEQALALASFINSTSPVVIQTIPANLSKVTASTGPGHPGVRAIEIVDGSPRGLSQGRRDRARIVHIADSLNLALVTGSDNHGWGRAAPGWTLFRIPGWRGMATDSLSRQLERALRDGRRQSTRTVERRVADGDMPLSVAFTAPVVAWRMLTTLSPDERVMWIVWAWGLLLLGRAWRRFRDRPPADA
jgi:hypothetical protein